MEPFVRRESAEGPALFYIDSWMQKFEGVTAGFTSRSGGVSTGEFDCLNCGLHVADRPEDVIANRTLVAEAIGIPLTRWSYGEQVHGDRIAVVTAADRGKGTLSRETAWADTDGFITRDPGVCLAALFADCVPLFFYDPVVRAAGLAHAGWKGTVASIAARTVEKMQEAFGSRPSNLVASVGPSIGACCYEVDRFVIDRVDEALEEAGVPQNGRQPLFYREESEGKYRLDLQQVNRQIMIKAGILPSAIEITKLCTSCRTDWFYSHRKEQGRTGRLLAWIGWNGE
ncbi:peptidoglycan editing factor PgeF [Paenibacillus aurantius]|uniref:Purine nucleoside phosphorylase n=1 Tax=Paenibacillus aurantius TaxID=2918900 RepID=A0AA96RGY0_9BACL|nr:peptidoglycan editing factor PgeF [Paenibacillus aurantius]WNQ13527.1 peptidoglycan editing factor PgeF [Paenibacillus aurantius]